MKKIRLHAEHKRKIAEEFKVTYQTVSMSLDYVFKSELSDKIRKRALELLQEEIDINKEVGNED